MKHSGVRRVFLLCAMFYSSVIAADSICYSTNAYPYADFLTPTDTGVAFLVQPLGAEARMGEPLTLYEMRGDADGFIPAGEVECKWGRCEGFERLDDCPEDMPEIRVAEEDVPERLRQRWQGEFKPEFLEQSPGACATVGDEVYFGLAFYGGEGAVGLGGVGRWNRKTDELEVRHPKRLQSVSVNHVAFDGERLWLGTYYDAECSGEIPKQRVLVYDWRKDGFVPGQGIANPLTCGFVANGFLQTAPDVMWVASDLGVTRVEFGPMEGSHRFGDRIFYGPRHWWAVDTPEGPRMKEGDCKDLYRDLLVRLPAEPIPTYKSVLSQFVSSLQQFEPGFLRGDYLRRLHEERGLETIAFVFRNVHGRTVVQACDSGEIFLPRGTGWWWAGLDQRAADDTVPDTAVERVMTGRVEAVPAETGSSYRRLHYVDQGTGQEAPFGACAGQSPVQPER